MASTTSALKMATEGARGASLSVHSAAGLALRASPEAARLLRAAEGLCRTAVALLAAGPPSADAVEDSAQGKDSIGGGGGEGGLAAAPRTQRPPAASGMGTSRSARRRRHKRDLAKEKGTGTELMAVDELEGAAAGVGEHPPPAAAEPPGSTPIGDLVGRGLLQVRAPLSPDPEALAAGRFDEALIRLAAVNGIGKDGRPKAGRRKGGAGP